MGKPTEPRAQRALAVRVLGMDVNGRPILWMVQTVNISRHGVVIEGLGSRVNPGDVVSLQNKDRKVRFRVVWVGEAGTEKAGQLGLEQVHQDDNLWQQDLLPDTGPDMRPRDADRRRSRRFEVTLPVELRSQEGTAVRAEIADISLTGCYVSTLFPKPLDTVVNIVFWLGDRKLAAKGRVRTSIPGVGCGIEFVDLSAEESNRLAEYLKNTSRLLNNL
jgi:hypothetical protein